MQVPAEVPCDALSEELSNDALLNRVQRQTFRYFWDFAHPTSGLTRERRFMPGRPADLVATGASGFGVMAILVGIERGWIRREEALHRLLTMVRHLERAQCYHGVFPHWLNGADRRDDPVRPQGRRRRPRRDVVSDPGAALRAPVFRWSGPGERIARSDQPVLA